MSTTTRRIREMSVVVESNIPLGLTLEEYRSERMREQRSERRAISLRRLLRRAAA